MSSDNYYLVWHRDGAFYVTMEFASSDDPADFDTDFADKFDTYEEAMDYAESEYSEYGVLVHESASSL